MGCDIRKVQKDLLLYGKDWTQREILVHDHSKHGCFQPSKKLWSRNVWNDWWISWHETNLQFTTYEKFH